MIRHDLRNYLNAIAAKAALSSKATDLTQVQKLSEEIGAACKTMARWANDLVDLSTMDTGVLALERHPHDPAGIIDTSVQAFSSLAQTWRESHDGHSSGTSARAV